MSPGAKMGILCGNIRRNGKYHDMMLSLALPGEILQNIVKMQHNCVSNGRTYNRKNFVPIIHENLIILQKPCINYMQVGYILPRKITMDIRDSMSATWRDVHTISPLFAWKSPLYEDCRIHSGHGSRKQSSSGRKGKAGTPGISQEFYSTRQRYLRMQSFLNMCNKRGSSSFSFYFL